MKKTPKKILLGILIIFISCITIQCIGPPKEKEKEIDYLSEHFEGYYNLRRFKSSVRENSKFSGAFFLIVGAASGSSKQELMTTFSWESNNNSYIISELPVTKIQVKIDSTIINPYISFNWDPFNWDFNIKNINDKFYSVNYITVYCKEEDFPYDIQLS